MITGPDSAAQISIQAAEYIRRFGALVPYDVCPPLLPVLIAGLGLAGVPAAAGYIVIVLAAYAGGCAAVFALVRRFQPGAVAAYAAGLYALAPSRLPPAAWEEGSLLLCWSLAPILLLALDSVRRAARPLNVAAGVIVVGLMWASNPAGVDGYDFVAMAELAVVLTACLVETAVSRQVVLIAFLAVAGWNFLLAPPRQKAPAELVVSAGENRGGETFGAVSLDVAMNPVLARAREVVSSPGRVGESILWLRAMAVGSLLTGDRQKFDGALECLDEHGGWCVYGLPDPNPAPAVLVSRRQWKNLPPVRGVYDIEGLSQYVAWSGRPEAAGFRTAQSAVIVEAKLGPLDVFLVRLNCRPGLRAYLEEPDSRELAVECDPLGFVVLDPGAEGATRVRLEFEPSWTQRLFPEGMPEQPLPGGEFPRITPGGVMEAVEFKPPPFKPGASLSIFGHNFVAGQTRVLFGETAGEVLWVGPRQINARIPENLEPGEISLVVESAGRHSFREGIVVGQ